ncbi:hypothetical protein COV20_00775 [Candidatus Woesearchaeota archaeon CG10_big_fil_rev_8_21_14_0_10_45_16]|nr:MAG: hypothetical protein COV20_00775 [Candidatus Woesearchaeota archaeon CG10_big_fil_rev_8_21_14_0_10_45_16]
MEQFLPTSLDEGKRHHNKRNSVFEQFDVIFITGDPYYDHPLSGIAILSRLLDKKSYKVGIIAQPETVEEFQACGKPKYFFCITSGLLDSMLANYTPMLKKRENVLVPERATITYTQKIKELFPGSMTIIGGVEATIRRFTHFDYKENTLRRGILNDSKADLLLFGNAERALLTLLQRMERSPSISSFPKIKKELDLPSIPGTAFRVKKDELPKDTRILPSYEECLQDKLNFNLLTRIHFLRPDDPFIEPCGLGFIYHTEPEPTLTEEEMDFIYQLPFTRKLHPASKNREFNESMVEKLQHSVILGRGCWGSCTFCVIPLVQGKAVAKRSQQSVLKEVEALYKEGIPKVNDLTLPTLNMYGSSCELYNHKETLSSPIIDKEIDHYTKKEYCNQQCVGCKHRRISDDLYPLLEGVERLQQKYQGAELELRSAIRHDIILDQPKLFRKIMQFISRLKIAPEHIDEEVLKNMNKGTRDDFVRFLAEYKRVNFEQGTKKNLVPYFVAAHPGSTKESMRKLKRFCDDNELYVNLTQVFTPTPGTVATAMYYSGENPLTREKIFVPRAFREKKDQKNILLRREADDFSDDQG